MKYFPVIIVYCVTLFLQILMMEIQHKFFFLFTSNTEKKSSDKPDFNSLSLHLPIFCPYKADSMTNRIKQCVFAISSIRHHQSFLRFLYFLFCYRKKNFVFIFGTNAIVSALAFSSKKRHPLRPRQLVKQFVKQFDLRLSNSNNLTYYFQFQCHP